MVFGPDRTTGRARPQLSGENPAHGRSMMHDGLVFLTGSPTDFSRPVFASILNTATLFPGMFAQISHAPSAVIAKFCGPFPKLGSMFTSDNFPSSAML